MQDSISPVSYGDEILNQHPMMINCATSNNVGQFQSLDNPRNTYSNLNTVLVPHTNKEGVMLRGGGLIEPGPVPYTASLADMYSHSHTSTQLSDMEIVTDLFPFVCGICSLKFNKILEFYCHFKVHDFCKYSEKYFHVCENKTRMPCDSTSEDIDLYRCGVCGLPFPSVCTLHDHMVNLEKVAGYIINVKTKMTESITYSNEENMHQSNNQLKYHSMETVSHSESCVPIDRRNNFTESVISEDTSAEQMYKKDGPTGIDNSASVDNYTQYMLRESRTIESSEVDTVQTFIPVTQDTACAIQGPTDEDHSEVDTNTVLQSKGINSVSFGDSNSPRTNEKETQENGYNQNVDSSPINKPSEQYSEPSYNCYSDSMHNIDKHNQQQTSRVRPVKSVHYTRQSRRRQGNDHRNSSLNHKRDFESITQPLHDHKKSSLNDKRENHISVITKTSSKTPGKSSIFVKEDDDDDGDDYLIREKKFDDPKQERRRLLMIKYQRQYRQRKKTKALALLSSKQTGAKTIEETKDVEIKEKLPDNGSNVPSNDRNVPSSASYALDLKVPCDVCGLLFKKRNLKRHAETHAEVNAYQCELCPKSFKTKNNLYAHKMHHRREKDLICDYCGKAFNNGPNLRQHLKIHVRERSLQCPICPKKFRSNYVLKDHIMRHSDSKPHRCLICGRTFKVAQEVRKHMLVHSEDRPHVCTTCFKCFKSKGNLVKHEKIHTK